jgi:hypothetical protein
LPAAIEEGTLFDVVRALIISEAVDSDDELAGTGLSLVIGGFRHLQITTRLVSALTPPAQRPGARPCGSPASSTVALP